MIFLLGLVLLVSVAFLMHFLVALEAERRRPPTGKVSVHMTTKSLAMVSEVTSRQPQKAGLPSNVTRLLENEICESL